MELADIEIVQDQGEACRCTEGFLRVRRLVVRNRYQDGERSEPYACDIVERRQVDAVAIALYEERIVDGRRRVFVALRRGIRAPVFLRRDMEGRGRTEPAHPAILELVAGVLEADDLGFEGVLHRAAEEAREEAGLVIEGGDISGLGAPFFPSPGITPEMVYLAACAARLDERGEPEGDGSVMEEGASVEVFELAEAIEMCRRGEIRDAKTELGLLRLCGALGYLPQLDLFVDELPEELRARHTSLGF
jgi:ADP-ribose pyrophosphatase